MANARTGNISLATAAAAIIIINTSRRYLRFLESTQREIGAIPEPISIRAPTGWASTAPGAGDVGWFKTAVITQPNLSVSLSIAGLYFNGTGSSGYDITSSSTAVKFTLTGTDSTGNGGTSNGTAAALRGENTSGTNTIDAPIILGAAAAATQVFYQAAGGTLIVNGVVSSTNAVTLSLKGGGTIQLNGANTFTSGSNINDAGTTLVIGNDSALVPALLP